MQHIVAAHSVSCKPLGFEDENKGDSEIKNSARNRAGNDQDSDHSTMLLVDVVVPSSSYHRRSHIEGLAAVAQATSLRVGGKMQSRILISLRPAVCLLRVVMIRPQRPPLGSTVTHELPEISSHVC